MPVISFNATDIAHSDQLMEHQLAEETGRNIVLDPDWITPVASVSGIRPFFYNSEIEFILIKTDSEVEFRRIMPLDRKAKPTSASWWDRRDGEQYYIFKVDPAQKILVVGSEFHPSVRFFRPRSNEQAESSSPSSSSLTRDSSPLDEIVPMWTHEREVSPWEAEHVYQERDIVTGGQFPPEHLAEVARRFKAWRARTTGSLFVYLMVPRKLSEGEGIRLRECGVRFFGDVSWVLHTKGV